ncbi:MAG: transposase [Planctomycetota bacterium]
MVRPKRIELPDHARFLTWSCWQRMQLLRTPEIRDALIESIAGARKKHEFALSAWVIMPEHVHMLIVPKADGAKTGEVLRTIKEPFARRVLKRWRELDAPVLTKLSDRHGRAHVWQRGGGYDRTLRTREELDEKIRYVHENPVRRGLVEHPEDWAWSSARWYAGDREGAIEIDTLA